jgi:lipoprotein signal peptidase
VFNIADSAIVCAAIFLALLMFRAEREERQLQAVAEQRQSVRPETGTPRR